MGVRYGAKLIADEADRTCPPEGCVTGGSVLAVFFCIIIGSRALGQVMDVTCLV